MRMSGARPNCRSAYAVAVVDAVRRREIGRDRAAPLPRFLPQHVGVGIGDDHLRAFLRQQVCDGFADAVRAGADIRKLALQLIVHDSPFASSRQRVARKTPPIMSSAPMTFVSDTGCTGDPSQPKCDSSIALRICPVSSITVICCAPI